ncbi:MAG: hypothetical protein LBH06_00065 [Rikenellaceae bacterium]|jgi:hypothetical protein|nr:hypothetical protein [Rikenellaceae bacterium]
MAAMMSASRADFSAKISGGKNKTLVINALRPKLVARMFAVVKHDKPVNN